MGWALVVHQLSEDCAHIEDYRCLTSSRDTQTILARRPRAITRPMEEFDESFNEAILTEIIGSARGRLRRDTDGLQQR